MPDDVAEIMRKLAEPFPYSDIEWRVGATNGDKTKGIALAYITNRAVQQRLDEVVGIDNWRNEFQEWKAGRGTICGLSLRINGEWITKWDGADDSNMEPIKGGLSDSMKRAAYQWGIGRYLYKLDEQWVPVEKRGNTAVIKQPPRLPDWALPEAERGKQSAAQSKPTAAQSKPTAAQSKPPTEPPKPKQETHSQFTGECSDKQLDMIFTERKRREKGWDDVFAVARVKGFDMETLRGKTSVECEEAVRPFLKDKLTSQEASALITALKAKPFRGHEAKQ